jgi:hypothetical protein
VVKKNKNIKSKNTSQVENNNPSMDTPIKTRAVRNKRKTSDIASPYDYSHSLEDEQKKSKKM